MKTSPIIFSGNMVLAILDDRKTQTRRVIKPQPPHDFGSWNNATLMSGTDGEDFGCPYGKPSDRLWVRETWAVFDFEGPQDKPDAYSIGYRADDECNWFYPPAEQRDLRLEKWGNYADPDGYWRPSIHMPRWASRLELEIIEIRVQRLRDIGQDDICQEGQPQGVEPIGWYCELWDALNAKRGFGWDTNPWVWILTFKTADNTGETTDG